MARSGKYKPDPQTTADIVWMVAKFLFAMSPLIMMMYFLLKPGKKKSKKKSDGFVADTVGNDAHNAAIGSLGFGGMAGGGGTGLAHM